MALVTAVLPMMAEGSNPRDAVAAAGKDGVVSLVYRSRVEHRPNGSADFEPLKTDAAGEVIRSAIGSLLPLLVLTVKEGVRIHPPVRLAADARIADPVMLELSHTLTRTLSVAETGADAIWTATVIAPVSETYNLPVPRAAMFGGQKFELVLADSGRPTTLTYGTTNGIASGFNAAGTIAAALAEDTVAERAAETKAEADLIAQQQRLVRCRANLAACT